MKTLRINRGRQVIMEKEFTSLADEVADIKEGRYDNLQDGDHLTAVEDQPTGATLYSHMTIVQLGGGRYKVKHSATVLKPKERA